MSRYGMKPYGTFLYGSDGSTNMLWALEIDWDHDGIFDGSNEASRMLGFTCRRGRENLLDENGESINRVMIGSASIVLDNHDRRFDPRYVDGPLYGNILPGRNARLTITDGDGGTTYAVFAGTLSDIKAVPGIDKRVRLEMQDCISWLNQDVFVGIQSTINLDDAVNAVLTAVGWPTIWGTDVPSSPDTIPYWWTDQDETAWNALNRIVEGNLGVVFIAADGDFTFRPRQQAGESVVTLTDDVLLKEPSLPQPWETVKNVIKVLVYTPKLQSTGDLWTLQDTPLIASGASIDIWAPFSYNDQDVPAMNVLDPVSTTDYTMNEDAEGGGADLTANFTVTAYKWSTTAKLTITNNGGTDGYITLLKIRGDALYISDPATLRNEDSSSIDDYGAKVLMIDSKWQQSITSADVLLDLLSTYFSTSKLFPTVQIETRPSLQFAVDLFSRVTLHSESQDIDDAYVVGFIEHSWLRENGQAVLTTLKLEPPVVVAGTWWTFPTQIGIDSYLAP